MLQIVSGHEHLAQRVRRSRSRLLIRPCPDILIWVSWLRWERDQGHSLRMGYGMADNLPEGVEEQL